MRQIPAPDPVFTRQNLVMRPRMIPAPTPSNDTSVNQLGIRASWRYGRVDGHRRL